jgi:chromosome partitioning protein
MYQRFQQKIALDTKRHTWTEPIQVGNRRLQSLDLIPCDIDLLGEDLGGAAVSGSFPTLELLRRNSKEFLRERRFLVTAVREVSDKYDYILIDCPPNLYLMTQNALIVSDWYVVTAIPDHLSTIGLSILQKKVKKIGEMIISAETFVSERGAPLKMAKFGGIVFVKVRMGGSMITNTHLTTMAKVRTLPGVGKTGCFSDYTTELIGYGEAAENSLPVWLHDSTNAKRAARLRQYEKITDEFLRRF